jgi:hypothetical protein
MSKTSCVVETATPLQRDLALAIIQLAAEIESECAMSGRSPNGIYRLKLQGRNIEMSYERFHGTQTRHSVID